MAEFVLMLWAGWALVNLLLFVLQLALVQPRYPCFNGLRVHMPAWVAARVEADELQALVEHEEGHRALCHVWVNLAQLCMLCWPVTPRQRARQELEADDCVANQLALASALRKISAHPFDLQRASRAERTGRARLLMGRQEAGDPASGTGDFHL